MRVWYRCCAQQWCRRSIIIYPDVIKLTSNPRNSGRNGCTNVFLLLNYDPCINDTKMSLLPPPPKKKQKKKKKTLKKKKKKSPPPPPPKKKAKKKKKNLKKTNKQKSNKPTNKQTKKQYMPPRNWNWLKVLLRGGKQCSLCFPFYYFYLFLPYFLWYHTCNVLLWLS